MAVGSVPLVVLLSKDFEQHHIVVHAMLRCNNAVMGVPCSID